MAGKYYQRRKNARRKSGIIAAFLLLVLAAVYILRHDQIEKWLNTVLGTRLSSSSGFSSPLCLTDLTQIPVYSGKLYVELNDNLVSHHHTLTGIDGLDYQILIEADYIANAAENGYSSKNIVTFIDKIMKTEAGKRLTKETFDL
jgi:hypothetical protein